MRAWMNGDLLADPTGAVLGVTDHGFTVGDGVFESIKTLDGRPFALTRHLERLARSATGLGLDAPDEADVRRGVEEVLAGTGDPLGRLRITLHRRARPRWGRAAATARPPWSSPTRRSSRRGSRPRSPPSRGPATSGARPPASRPRRTPRTSSRWPGPRSSAAPRRSSPTPAATSARGPAPTSSTSSTASCAPPPSASGCLAGVTRALVLEWCGGREVDEPIEVAQQADEAFLVSTTRDVQAISRWDGARAAGAGTGHRGVRRDVAPPRGRADRPLILDG